MADAVRLDILARSRVSRARLGRLVTPHGDVRTPAFMPVGTRGSVKGILPDLLERSGADICLANTYHLLLRPGPEIVRDLGGLHGFMNWPRPILTDSGGYQAYSMADLNRVDDDAVTFKSIIDGSMITLRPEDSIAVQNALGADIIMAFDDCPPPLAAEAPPAAGPESGADPVDPRLARVLKRDARGRKQFDLRERLRVANERTVRWLERCKAAHARAADQALFGIVQGGTDPEARAWSASRITAIDLPGYAIGGVAVGESPEDIAAVVRHTAPLLPDHKPRYLMGVGYERDILAAVLAGVDMFDCVLPTRNARNANAFTPTGQIRLRNAKFASDLEPIEPGCDCPACIGWPSTTGAPSRPFTRGYLRHLFLAEEMLGPILVTLHNLRYFQRFMGAIREAITKDDWAGLVGRFPVAAPALVGSGVP